MGLPVQFMYANGCCTASMKAEFHAWNSVAGAVLTKSALLFVERQVIRFEQSPVLNDVPRAAPAFHATKRAVKN